MLLAWKVYRATGQSWALAFWCAGLINAFFGNSLESPIGAVPFYLLLGLAIGPALGMVPQGRAHLTAIASGRLTMAKAYQASSIVQNLNAMTRSSAGES